MYMNERKRPNLCCFLVASWVIFYIPSLAAPFPTLKSVNAVEVFKLVEVDRGPQILLSLVQFRQMAVAGFEGFRIWLLQKCMSLSI